MNTQRNTRRCLLPGKGFLPHNRAMRKLFLCVINLSLFLALGLLPFSNLQNTRANGSFVVNSEADSNLRDSLLTLREAILVANGTLVTVSSGEASQLGGCDIVGGTIQDGCGYGFFDNITFDPLVTQINLGNSPLQLYDAGTWIKGNQGVPQINGVNSNSSCLQIYGNAISISDLSIVNFNNSSDIDIYSGTNNRIFHNFLGTIPGAVNCYPSGVSHLNRAGVMIHQTNGSPGFENGAAYIHGNTIACHTYAGVEIEGSDYVYVGIVADGSTADGNNIGLNLSGVALPNLNGIVINPGITQMSSNNIISNNVISGNSEFGIFIDNSDHNLFTNNKIGTAPGSFSALPNGYDGVRIYGGDAYENTIGASGILAGNIIAGNGQSGITLMDGAHDNHVDANYIGINPSLKPIPNGLAGIAITNSSNANNIGTQSGTTQTISYNSREGVYIENSSKNDIGSSNEISLNSLTGIAMVGDGSINNRMVVRKTYGNGGLPFDLGEDGHTPNGSRTPPGPNNWIQYPLVTSSAGTQILGTTCATCYVDIYRAYGNPALNYSGGDYVISVLADAFGYWYVDLSTSLYPTLTVRDIALVSREQTGNTSEMSPRPILFLPMVRK